ncbi:CDGSH-type Zn-finger protein [Diaminobutyricimonas aerilata]|uniref:CDGSH-type Zn-finger protein n=1 Tax=Diaminobutyricimonas aerilata TaxID=1162967 RepID=A0A2M9CLV0_9MICO|nr:CDGSH iron-sulfur domain-containing protein [Diaminobutyricimonas aerilata]PJJ72862.1 CDGSH-type Zn-finger protein [Diaminobutyricimonas aerilata]
MSREHPDEVSIVAYPDGPLLVRGPAQLVDADGTPIHRERRTVALCRCGKSTIKPFCDGTHKLIGFRTEPPPPA